MSNINKKIKDYYRTPEYVDESPGRITGTILQPFEIPVSYLKTLPGLREEHTQLHFDMKKVKKLSELIQDESFRKKHPIALEVHHSGKVFIFDGSHRTKAAQLTHLKSYPCIVRFYGGSEDNIDLDEILKNHPIHKEAFDMNKKENKIAKLDDLIAKAKLAIETNQNITQYAEQIIALADGQDEIGGTPTGYREPADAEYQNQRLTGVEYNTEKDPDAGDIDQNTMDRNAKLLRSIRIANNLFSKASHIEVIEIPLKELHLDPDLDYRIGGNEQIAFVEIKKYVKLHVYDNMDNFSLVRLEHDGNTFFVHILVYDRQLNYTAKQNNTKSDKLNKLSYRMTKTAWKRRETINLGDNDKTGLVKCPLEGMNLVRSCGTCPLAGNPETYINDGFVDCHFDDITSYLSGNTVREHRPVSDSK